MDQAKLKEVVAVLSKAKGEDLVTAYESWSQAADVLDKALSDSTTRYKETLAALEKKAEAEAAAVVDHQAVRAEGEREAAAMRAMEGNVKAAEDRAAKAEAALDVPVSDPVPTDAERMATLEVRLADAENRARAAEDALSGPPSSHES